MKTNYLIILISITSLMVLCSNAFSQKKQFMDTIEVCMEKNAYIKISNFELKHIDVGGEDNVIFEEDLGVIKIKALNKDFKETNFLLIGTDTLIQFMIRYSANPKLYLYTYDLTPKKIVEPVTEGNENTKKPDKPIEPGVSALSFEKVKEIKPNTNLGIVQNNIKFRITNLCVDKTDLYFVVTIANNTKVEYQIDYVNFEVRSRAKLKQSGLQSIFPEFISYKENVNVVNPGKTEKLIFALDKFYLRKDEILTISVFEKALSSKGRQYGIDLAASDFKSLEFIE